jgi:D-aspartate ligase
MANSMLKGSLPPAVVVGVCAHGLSVIRALAGHDFEIFALDSNPRLPGARTRLARFIKVEEDINTKNLIDALLHLYEKLWSGRQPILFLTNDNMVLNIGKYWQRLQGKFLLSWSGSREVISNLLIKSSLDSHCRMVNINYPKSLIAESNRDLMEKINDIRFPVMIKPAKPLSAFKAEVAQTTNDLLSLITHFPNEYPLVIQDWIPGSDSNLHFSNLYLIDGKPYSRFEGRKLRSSPPGRGQGTIVEPYSSQEVFDLAMRFFAPTGVSGPAALELKRDEQGRWWVIEPTLGRTEFLVGCCVANNVNIPLIEYYHQVGCITESTPQRDQYIWFNAERDPAALIAYMFGRIATTNRHRKWCFLYLSKNDLYPFLAALYRDMVFLLRRSIAKVYYSVRRLRKTS